MVSNNIFKKIAICLAVAVALPSVAFAQNDWANVAKYSQANAEVGFRPVAVFMGDSYKLMEDILLDTLNLK